MDKEHLNKINQWRNERKDERIHFGVNVDLTIGEAWCAIDTAPIRLNNHIRRTGAMFKAGYTYAELPEIFYDNEWWEIARTDLRDDVCTSTCTDNYPEVNELRQRLKDTVSYGARLHRWDDGRRTFAIIDSISDG
jgi:hypothetical protein